jgi:hypothetical protein
MNEQETSTSPPDTLIGLGPPEPPEKYGEHPADAPETLRAWSTSRRVAIEDEASIIVRSLPLEPLLSGTISDSSEGSDEVLSLRQPAARRVLFWAAPVLLTAIAIATSTTFSSGHPRPAAARPAVPARSSTTRVVGGPWVLRQDISRDAQDVQDESAEPARIFYREARTRPHRTTTRASAPPPVEAPSPETEIARNHSRVQEVADSVELEDEVPEPKAPDAVESRAPEPAQP